MSGAHAHERAHGASEGRRHVSRRLGLVLGVTLTWMLAEVAGGLAAHSLALLADAGHLLSDAAALGLSLFATWIAARPATSRRTYGYYRAEILAALANGALLVALSIMVLTEAIHRLGQVHEVNGRLMSLVAAGGVALNLTSLVILRPARDASLNARGAWLHVASDALGSLGALCAGLLAWTCGWHWADPAASIAIALLVVWSSWTLLRESVAVLMEGTPGHIDVDSVRDALLSVDGVRDVHDLHVWTITSGLEALSGHVTVASGHARDAVLLELREILETRFGIGHSTLQLEPESCDIEDHHAH